MKRPFWTVLVLVCCGSPTSNAPAKDTTASTPLSSDSGDTSSACNRTTGTLAISVTVDGTPPSSVEKYRALVRSGEERPIEMTPSSDAVAEVDLEESVYEVRALSLSGSAGSGGMDSVVVLAWARTEITVDMVGIAGWSGADCAEAFVERWDDGAGAEPAGASRTAGVAGAAASGEPGAYPLWSSTGCWRLGRGFGVGFVRRLRRRGRVRRLCGGDCRGVRRVGRGGGLGARCFGERSG